MPINPADRDLSNEELVDLFSTPPTIPVLSAPAFLFDEDVDQRSIQPIRKMGLLVSTVMDEGEAGEPSDYQVLALARQMGRALVTSDKSFRHLHQRLLDLNLGHAGIIYLSMKRETADLVAFVAEVHRQVLEKDMPEMLYHMWWKV